MSLLAISWLILNIQPMLAYHYVTVSTGRFLCTETDDISKYVDLSNLEVIRLDENSYLNGFLEWKYQFDKNDVIQAKITITKKVLGQWRKTPFTITRVNLCESFFNPNEIWYGLVKDFKEDEKVCPPQPGMRYSFDHVSTTIEGDDPIRNMEGTYRAYVNITSKDMVLCFVMECDHFIS